MAEPFTWSYSALKNYETCPLKHQQVDRLKNYAEEENEAMRWGKYVHDVLAKAIAGTAPLPITMRAYQQFVDSANKYKAHGIVAVEQKLGFNRDFQPCEWFGRDVWFRGVIDFWLLAGKVAILWDWKTGKVLIDSVQLALFAQMVFIHHPEIEKVVTSYVWLQDDATSPETYTRDDMGGLWTTLMPRVQQMQASYEQQSYLPIPSGLCKRHCPVVNCQYHGKGTY